MTAKRGFGVADDADSGQQDWSNRQRGGMASSSDRPTVLSYYRGERWQRYTLGSIGQAPDRTLISSFDLVTILCVAVTGEGEDVQTLPVLTL